jgi:hypothetical protein
MIFTLIEFSSYLESVDLRTATPTQAQLDNITILQAKLQTAQDKSDNEENLAYSRYMADIRAQAAHQTFGSWVTQHDALLTSYRQAIQVANTDLQNYQVKIYGPQYATISTQRNKILNQADDELSPEPGYVTSDMRSSLNDMF